MKKAKPVLFTSGTLEMPSSSRFGYVVPVTSLLCLTVVVACRPGNVRSPRWRSSCTSLQTSMRQWPRKARQAGISSAAMHPGGSLSLS